MIARRTLIVCLCLLALIWCQVVAAAGACGAVVAMSGAAAQLDSSGSDCHGDGADAACKACGVLAASAPAGSKAFADDLPALVVPSWLAIAHPATVAMAVHHDAFALPPRNPPHFLGRLLI